AALYLTTGTRLMSTRGHALLTIVADTCGRHDTLGGACSRESNVMRYAFDKESRQATGFAKMDTDMTIPPVPEGEQPGLEATGYYSPPRSTFASGIHAAIVETDPVTAEIHVERYAVVHDCGNVINPR
ncbi:MAG: DUF1989 domain-containing protein, partial [Rhodococcus sp.]|nr:DUF1989 domain-containing protein [Rhodococcus sp. (in: high G+C Gram-positive bacteria)]